jgi:hypothetical protein
MPAGVSCIPETTLNDIPQVPIIKQSLDPTLTVTS